MIKKIIKKVAKAVTPTVPVEMVEVNTMQGIMKVKKTDYRADTLQVNGK